MSRQFLNGQKDKEAPVFVVLTEDLYETAFGDGEFHDFAGVFLTREDAQRHIDQNRSRWNKFYLKTNSVWSSLIVIVLR